MAEKSVLGAIAVGVGVAAFALVTFNGWINRTEGQPLLSNIFPSVSWRNAPPSQTGYVPGAPRNPAECIRRGGRVVNNGRGCEGYT